MLASGHHHSAFSLTAPPPSCWSTFADEPPPGCLPHPFPTSTHSPATSHCFPTGKHTYTEMSCHLTSTHSPWPTSATLLVHTHEDPSPSHQGVHACSLLTIPLVHTHPGAPTYCHTSGPPAYSLVHICLQHPPTPTAAHSPMDSCCRAAALFAAIPMEVLLSLDWEQLGPSSEAGFDLEGPENKTTGLVLGPEG